jgi:thiol-disulfide isomerase/thioredoxin
MTILDNNDVYTVILNNQLGKGQTLEEVIQNLSYVLHQTPEDVRGILCHPSFIVEESTPHQQAKTIQQLIIKAGVGCQIKKIYRTDAIDVSTLARNSQVICAECDKQQSVSSNCQYCGINFFKFKTKKHPRPSPYSNQPRSTTQPQHYHTNRSANTNNTARNGFIGLITVIIILFAISTLQRTSQVNKNPITLNNGSEMYAMETLSIRHIDHYEDLIVDGYITIIDFSADWCGVCKQLDKFEQQVLNQRDDVIVRKLDVTQIEDFQLARKKYDLNFRAVPFSIIYDQNGDFIADDSRGRAGQRYIYSLID